MLFSQAFANMTLATRRALCAVMVFAVVDKAGTIVMNDGEELDSWSVILNGHVEISLQDESTQQLHMGDRYVYTYTYIHSSYTWEIGTCTPTHIHTQQLHMGDRYVYTYTHTYTAATHGRQVHVHLHTYIHSSYTWEIGTCTPTHIHTQQLHMGDRYVYTYTHTYTAATHGR